MSGLSRSGSMPWLPKSARSTIGVPPEKPLRSPPPARRVDEAELVGGQQVADALDRDRRVEQAEAAAEHRLVALVEAPGEADARAEVVLVGVDQRLGQAHLVGGARAAERDQAGRQQGRDLCVGHDVIAAVDGPEVREGQVLLVPRADDLVAQAEEHRQALVDPPVVLREDARCRSSGPRAARGWSPGRARRRAGRAGSR